MACVLRARAEINSHFAAGPQARWRGASDELYPGRYVRSEQQSQRACGPQPAGARRRRARIGFVAAPRRCPTASSSRRLASARPALAPKCEFISARGLRRLLAGRAEGLPPPPHRRLTASAKAVIASACGVTTLCDPARVPHCKESWPLSGHERTRIGETKLRPAVKQGEHAPFH